MFKRFRLWTGQGLWERILERLPSDFQSRGKIEGSNIRAHKRAAGAKEKHGLFGRVKGVMH